MARSEPHERTSTPSIRTTVDLCDLGALVANDCFDHKTLTGLCFIFKGNVEKTLVDLNSAWIYSIIRNNEPDHSHWPTL